MMKVNGFFLPRIITFPLILILMTGCQPVIGLQESTPVSTSTDVIFTPIVTEERYPSSPEEVIRAFLITYPSDQIYAIQFLSPDYVQKLDPDTASQLLPATGEVMGFIIESGFTSAESESSEILANIAFQDPSYEMYFSLTIVDGRWMITRIWQK